MQLAPFYRRFELPWEDDPESNRRFRRLVLWGTGLFLLFALVLQVVRFPEPVSNVSQVPERLARLMVEERPQPPPPPPPPPKPLEQPRPEARPQPEQRVADARRKAEQSLSRVRDELADLRRAFTDEPAGQTRNLTGAVGAESKAERSLITSKAGTGSAGVQSADSSRGFGSGAGALSGNTTGAVSSNVASIGSGNQATRTGSSGKPARSQEEIEQEFDRNKGAIYALYSRALREHPELRGKVVLEFTIAASGEVTACRVVSSELNDAELERRIVARVRLIRFPARDVAPITTTKPIEFFPA
ncbi:MAG: AgmX/PglI C-terminal domain-containing protein [Steroidobacteraceae bacterium]